MKRARILRKISCSTNNKKYSRVFHLSSSNTWSRYKNKRYSIIGIQDKAYEIMSSLSGEMSKWCSNIKEYL